jgi:N-methylhydantoinase A/oxoprolinase/acetone carboxylase beta subunit
LEAGVVDVTGEEVYYEKKRGFQPMARPAGFSETFIIDVDVGGTFTDAIVSSRSRSLFIKVDTTQHELSLCLQEVLQRAVAELDLPDVRCLLTATTVARLSTSLSTNFLVEGIGAQCGLIVPQGWRGSYISHLRSINSPSLRLVEEMIAEVSLNGPQGAIDQVLEDEIRDSVQKLLERGVSIIVVSVATGEAWAQVEQMIKQVILRYYPSHFIGSLPVLLSSQISSSPDFFERTNTAVLNAYCHRPMANIFYQIEDFLRKEGYPYPLLVVHCNGGSARVAKTRAILTINSGAAAGVLGVGRLAGEYDLEDVISVDVGGTTTEIGLLLDGEIDYGTWEDDGNPPVDLPRPVALSLGLGGGSLVRMGQSGELLVGPQSAGAFPGPACYELGGTIPTLTDAYLILGYLDQHYYLGGAKKINLDRAVRAVTEHLAVPLGVSCEEAALRVKKRALEILGKTVTAVMERTGVQEEEFALAAVGGAGGCVGPELFARLRMKKMHFFRHGAVFGAYGSSGMDVVHLYEHRFHLSCFGRRSEAQKNAKIVNAVVADIQRLACKDMRGEGFRGEDIRFDVEAEFMTPNGRIPVRTRMPSPFLWPSRDWPTIAERVAVKLKDENPETWETITLSRLFVRAKAHLPRNENGADSFITRNPKGKNSFKGTRAVYGDSGTWLEYPVYEWDLLPAPLIMKGPAILEASHTTVLLPPGTVLELDQNLNGTVRLIGSDNEDQNHGIPGHRCPD